MNTFGLHKKVQTFGLGIRFINKTISWFEKVPFILQIKKVLRINLEG